MCNAKFWLHKARPNKMKIILLGDASSIHIQRWANSLCVNGDIVFVVSAHNFINGYHSKIKKIKLSYSAPIGYILSVYQLTKIVNGINPDVVNSHYATGYGFLSSFIRRFPVILSVWGSDVYLFPTKSLLHKLFIKFNLSKCTSIASTIKDMAGVVRKLVKGNKEIYITPFGIDVNFFQKKDDLIKEKITVGTTKGFDYTYGTDILIQAFADILIKYPNLNIKLLLTGSGDMKQYVNLAKSLRIDGRVEFKGHVAHRNIVHYINEIDIYVAFSRSESFGVSVLEASSCEIPVITSDSGGLPEVVQNGETGYIVNLLDTANFADRIYELITDREKRASMGRKGRRFVTENYLWNDSILKMKKAYSDTIKDFPSNK